MTLKDNKSKTNQPSDSPELYAAKLAYIGSSISTLGDGLQAIAAGIALEALEKQSSQDQNTQSNQSEKMQKQIDYLIKELKQIKKFLY